MQESAAELESEIKATMLPATRKEQPSGKTYRKTAITRKASPKLLAAGFRRQKGNDKRVVVGANFHRASAPGQAPAIDTGGLVNSIRAQKIGEMRASVSSSKKYADPLDNPKPENKLKPRPFFRSTAKNFTPKFKQNIQDAIDKAE